jgi:hypothetical protein
MAFYFIHDYDRECSLPVFFPKQNLEDAIVYTDNYTSFQKLTYDKRSYRKDNLLITFNAHSLQANVELRDDPDLLTILSYLEPTYFCLDESQKPYPIEKFYQSEYVTGLLDAMYNKC